MPYAANPQLLTVGRGTGHAFQSPASASYLTLKMREKIQALVRETDSSAGLQPSNFCPPAQHCPSSVASLASAAPLSAGSAAPNRRHLHSWPPGPPAAKTHAGALKAKDGIWEMSHLRSLLKIQSQPCFRPNFPRAPASLCTSLQGREMKLSS